MAIQIQSRYPLMIDSQGGDTVSVVNTGAVTVYYATTPAVTSSSYDGSLAAGSSVEYEGRKWFTVAEVNGYPSSGEVIANYLHDQSFADDVTVTDKLYFGSLQDTNLYRSGADTLVTDDRFVSRRESNGDIWFQASISGQAQEQFRITSSATGPVLLFGGGSTGTDTNLYRSAADVLKTDDQFVAADGITTRTVAGAVSDGSFTATPASGTIAVDTTNSKIYVRIGSTWKSVTVA